MKAEKLKNGLYRVRKQVNGQRISKYFDHVPSKKEMNLAFSEIVEEAKVVKHKKKFSDCADRYINSKSNLLSPSTIGEYRLKVKRLSTEFQNLPVDKIGKTEIQDEINRLAERLVPKTVTDMYGFINSVLGMYQTNYAKYKITLPQRKKAKPYIPTSEDIRTIIKESENTSFDLAIKLGCWGLRRSEICCITKDDVEKITTDENNPIYVMHINKAYVQNKATKEWVVKSTKTTESERDIIIPKDIAEAIIERGRAYDGFAGSISNWMSRTQKRLGMKHFTLHKERHFFATNLMQMGLSQKDIQKMGGWSTDNILKTVYQHEQISTDRLKQQSISNQLLQELL